MAFAAFDVLELDGQSVMDEPWTARRKRLEDLLEAPPPGVCVVPVAEDEPDLWDTWVGMGGEGIVPKERTAVYRPGVRSPAWLKLKGSSRSTSSSRAELRSAFAGAIGAKP